MFDFLLAGEKIHQLFSFLPSGFKHKLRSVLNFIYYSLQSRTKTLKFPKLLIKTVNFVMALYYSVFFRCHFYMDVFIYWPNSSSYFYVPVRTPASVCLSPSPKKG